MNVVKTCTMLLVGLSSLALGACASMDSDSMDFGSVPVKAVDTPLGKVLADSKRMTLYVFDKDSPGKSVCNGKCAKAWPPMMTTAGATASGKFKIVTRDDGSKQWAYDGRPLYGWFKDKKPGDVTGDGVGGTWHVVKLSGTSRY